MSTNNTYLAVFLGSKNSPRRAAWDALPEGERRAKEREGMTAWQAWVEKHHADSHEAAAKLFEMHPHFSIFPGESVEIMPILPIPGAPGG